MAAAAASRTASRSRAGAAPGSAGISRVSSSRTARVGLAWASAIRRSHGDGLVGPHRRDGGGDVGAPGQGRQLRVREVRWAGFSTSREQQEGGEGSEQRFQRGPPGSGKTAVAITHYTRYFGIADRALRLEDGKLLGTSGATVSEPSWH